MLDRQDGARREITIAELCAAIAEERVPAIIRDGVYVVERADLVRLRDASAGSLGSARCGEVPRGTGRRAEGRPRGRPARPAALAWSQRVPAGSGQV